jgi:hypothetical protein
MASTLAQFVLPPNLVVVPFNTSILEMLQRPIEFAQASPLCSPTLFSDPAGSSFSAPIPH